jgi:hypothetical protein
MNNVIRQSIPNGPISFDRLLMSVDSLTKFKRTRHRQRLEFEQSEFRVHSLNNGPHRSCSIDAVDKHSTDDRPSFVHDKSAAERLSFRSWTALSNSYNTSAEINDQNKRQVSDLQITLER